ncbi:NUDIX domain-containing protein [Oerskovia sp. NPDC056781]|uniref:NUDIX domain-containing protein n=1 Tax=Oerskovia sp. NPDC056781 TaxID=3345942 RepID=UPI00366D17CB
MVTSAGLLLYRVADDGAAEVLLGHMGGPLWARKDERGWTIPKGEHASDEDAHDAAVREFGEELGSPPPDGPEVDLGEVRQRAGKTVRAWARRADFDVSTAVSNSFEMEWPPRSGRRATFPELDRVAWVPLARARELVVAGQVGLLDRLEEALTEP